MKKNLTRFVSSTLSIALVLSLSVPCFAAKSNSEKEMSFDDLPNDAIVCYMYGEPVYKYEIGENNEVLKDFGDLVDTYAVDPNIDSTLPSSHRGEMIRATARSYGISFDQREEIYYVPKNDVSAVASALRNSSDASTAAGYVLAIAGIGVGIGSTFGGAVVSVFSLLFGSDSLIKGNVASSMENKANNGDHVKLVVTTNKNGTFYNTSVWDGISCVRYNLTGVTHYTIDQVVCEHNKSPWN